MKIVIIIVIVYKKFEPMGQFNWQFPYYKVICKPWNQASNDLLYIYIYIKLINVKYY